MKKKKMLFQNVEYRLTRVSRSNYCYMAPIAFKNNRVIEIDKQTYTPSRTNFPVKLIKTIHAGKFGPCTLIGFQSKFAKHGRVKTKTRA